MDIQTKDGIVLRGIPDGTPEEAIKARIAEIRAQRSAPGTPPPEEPKDRPLLGPGSAFSEITNAAARNITQGLSDKAAAAGTAVGKSLKGEASFSDAYRDALSSKRAAGESFKEESPVLYQVGATPGFIASMGLMRGDVPASLGGKMLQGAKAGATYGGLSAYGANDDESLEQTVKDVGGGVTIGGTVGGLIPPAIAGVKVAGRAAGRFAEPIYEGGRAKILNRYQDNLVEPNARQKIVQALQSAREIVPGSKPTAGEAMSGISEATGLAAHQKIIAKTPGVSGQFVTREAEQEAARRVALEGVGGTKAGLDAAEMARGVRAASDYGKAYANAIKADSKLAELSQNPYFRDALPDALKLAEANGLNSKTDLTRVLHYVKISLDKMLARTGDTALANTEKGAVQSLQKDLIGWMGAKNPDYEAARAAFAAASKPINEMQVGQYLQSKLVAPLENTERAGVFAQAVRDAPGTIKRSTGGPRFTELNQVLSPKNESVVNAILEDLQRKGAFEKLAKGTSLPGGSRLIEGSKGVQLPNLLSRPAMLANFVMKTIGEGADKKINKLAAQRYLNPQMLAESLKDVPVSQRGAIVEALLQRLGTRSTAEINGGQ